jgi:hypothetical protein
VVAQRTAIRENTGQVGQDWIDAHRGAFTQGLRRAGTKEKEMKRQQRHRITQELVGWFIECVVRNGKRQLSFGDEEQEILDVKINNTERLIHDLQRQQKENYKEIKANFFAAELLMPMDECSRIEFESEGATREELTAGLIRRFGVSRAAAAIRVEELRLGVVEGSLF